MATTIIRGTHDQVVRATLAVAGRPVVSCRNPADAASPVMLHYGTGRGLRQLGQAADWRHAAEEAAAEQDAELVTTHYIDGGWQTTTTADARRVAELVGDWQRQDAAAADRDAARRQDAEISAAAARIRAEQTALVARVFGVDPADVDCAGTGLNDSPTRITARQRSTGRDLSLVRAR